MLLAAVAAATRTISLGTGILLAPLAHPIRLAEDAAVVDLISAGRLILGLGLGWREEEFAGFELATADRVPRLEHAVSVLREAWSPEGRVGDAGVSITPKPFRSGGPPIWFGGVVDATVERSGRLADGFLATIPPWDRDTLERHARTLRSLDRPFTVNAHVGVFVWDGPEEPWEMVRDYQWYSGWKFGDAAEPHGPRAGRPPAAAPPRPPGEEASDNPWGGSAPLRGGSVVGRPEEVLDSLRAFKSILGPDGHLIARAYYPGMPWELQARQVELLGEIAAELKRDSR